MSVICLSEDRNSKTVPMSIHKSLPQSQRQLLLSCGRPGVAKRLMRGVAAGRIGPRFCEHDKFGGWQTCACGQVANVAAPMTFPFLRCSTSRRYNCTDTSLGLAGTSTTSTRGHSSRQSIEKLLSVSFSFCNIIGCRPCVFVLNSSNNI